MSLSNADRPALKVGDKIRILEDGLDLANVFKGDVLEVTSLEKTYFRTEAPLLKYTTGEWVFVYEDEGTGWKKYEEAGE